MHRFYIRHQRVGRIINAVKVGYYPFSDSGRDIVILRSIGLHRPVGIIFNCIKRRNICPGNASRCLVKESRARIASVFLHLYVEPCQLGKVFLPFSDRKAIEEIGKRLSVVRTRSSAHDDRAILSPIRRMERDTGKVKHIKNVSIAKLVLKRKRHKIKVLYRVAALVRRQRETVLAHLLLHVDPRSIDTLAPNILLTVQTPVKYPDPEIRHSYLVCIGKAEDKACFYLLFIFNHLTVFTTGVATGL